MIQPALGVTILLAFGLGACRSVRHEKLEPLNVLRQQAVLRVIEPGAARLHAEWSPPEERAQGQKVRLKLEMFGVDPDCLRQALGEGPTLLGAVIVPREQAARMSAALASRDESDVHVLSDSQLQVFAGSDAYLSVCNQRAFIGAFEISTTADGAIADPRVDVAQEGLLFHVDVGALPTADGIGLHFELTQSFLDKVFIERRVGLHAGLVPVTLQIPVGICDRLSASLTLRGDEAIVFAGDRPVEDGKGRAMLAVLTAELATD